MRNIRHHSLNHAFHVHPNLGRGMSATSSKTWLSLMGTTTLRPPCLKPWLCTGPSIFYYSGLAGEEFSANKKATAGPGLRILK